MIWMRHQSWTEDHGKTYGCVIVRKCQRNNGREGSERTFGGHQVSAGFDLRAKRVMACLYQPKLCGHNHDDDCSPHRLSTIIHSKLPSETTPLISYTLNPQRYRSLPHRRCTRVIATTFVRIHVHRAKHALPRHPPTLRDLPWQTHPRHARGPRPKTTHANGVPCTYT